MTSNIVGMIYQLSEKRTGAYKLTRGKVGKTSISLKAITVNCKI